MIYCLLFWEFFKIGLFAVGGGLVTIPFLFNLSEKYMWFTKQELTDMIAVSQSTPGPLGINMATYAGYNVAGIIGALIATLSEVLPAVIIIYFIAGALEKFKDNNKLEIVLQGLRPSIIALILFAGWDISRISLVDTKSCVMFLVLLALMQVCKISPIWYIGAAAIAGIIFQI